MGRAVRRGRGGLNVQTVTHKERAIPRNRRKLKKIIE